MDLPAVAVLLLDDGVVLLNNLRRFEVQCGTTGRYVVDDSRYTAFEVAFDRQYEPPEAGSRYYLWTSVFASEDLPAVCFYGREIPPAKVRQAERLPYPLKNYDAH